MLDLCTISHLWSKRITYQEDTWYKNWEENINLVATVAKPISWWQWCSWWQWWSWCMMAIMATIHDGNNGDDHDKYDGDAARSHLGHNGAPYPALPRPTPFAWVGHKINQICSMVPHWIFTASPTHPGPQGSVIQKQKSCKRETLGTLMPMVMLMLVMVKTNWTRGPVLNVKHSIDALQSIAHQVHSMKSALLHCAGGPCLRSANCPLCFSLRSHNIYWEIIFCVCLFDFCPVCWS